MVLLPNGKQVSDGRKEGFQWAESKLLMGGNKERPASKKLTGRYSYGKADTMRS